MTDRANTVYFNKAKLERLKKAYAVAVEKQQEVFVFEGNSLLAAYAKYLTEYLDQ